jgi:hypothetical protein
MQLAAEPQPADTSVTAAHMTLILFMAALLTSLLSRAVTGAELLHIKN